MASTTYKIFFIVFRRRIGLGWNDVSFHGSNIHTSNIDSLARKGIVLNNYYVQPICTPTRGALLTGKYPIRLGLQHGVIGGDEPRGLPLNHTTMAEHMKTLGYSTHIVGKWHLGFFRTEYTPTRRGFDSHVGFWTGGESYFSHIRVASKFNETLTGLDFRRNLAVNNDSGTYSTDYYTEKADNIIRRHNPRKPLFLYMAHQAVHVGLATDPLEVPQRYIDRFLHIKYLQLRKYAGMVSALDDSVGKIYKTLQQAGLINNTIFVFSSDNGAPVVTRQTGVRAGCNLPLRGHKGQLWEGGTRANAFIYSPLLNKTGYVSSGLMHVTDWLPTFYGAAGGSISQLGKIDGKNMWAMLSLNGHSPRQEFLYNIDPIAKTFGLRLSEYKLLKGPINNRFHKDWVNCTPSEPSAHIHDRRFLFDIPNTLIVNCGRRPQNYKTNCQPEKSPCLFHIPSDPCEYNNIAPDKPKLVSDMLRRLDVYAKMSVPPNNRPRDPKANPSLLGGVWAPWMDDIV